MTTFVGMQTHVENMLAALIELEYDAIEAYKAAVKHLKTPKYKQAFEKFQKDHESHVSKLSNALADFDFDVPKQGDFKKYLTVGKVEFANLVGDEAILMAMYSNEKDTNTAYERAVKHKDLEPELMTLLEHGLKDEQKHKQWIIEALDIDA